MSILILLFLQYFTFLNSAILIWMLFFILIVILLLLLFLLFLNHIRYLLLSIILPFINNDTMKRLVNFTFNFVFLRLFLPFIEQNTPDRVFLNFLIDNLLKVKHHLDFLFFILIKLVQNDKTIVIPPYNRQFNCVSSFQLLLNVLFLNLLIGRNFRNCKRSLILINLEVMFRKANQLLNPFKELFMDDNFFVLKIQANHLIFNSDIQSFNEIITKIFQSLLS